MADARPEHIPVHPLKFSLFSLFSGRDSWSKPVLNLRCAGWGRHYTATAKSGWRFAEDGPENRRSWRVGIPMEKLLLEYLPILIFIAIALVISAGLVVVPNLIAPKKPDPEKLSAYECGFEAFGDARMKFDVRYYLVSILFIIFDLEVAFLFPWAITLGGTGLFAFWSMMVFLAVLTIGFIYEWKKGALEWE
jgi:NADH-quinone oxidoreductase subunit A